MEFRKEKTKRGFTLFYAVLTTSLLLALGLAIFNITLKELLLSSDARESQNAFYAADAALECALYWDLAGPSPAFGFYGDSLGSGLRAYWRLDEEADENIAYDYSGNSDRNGTLLNDDGTNPTWTTQGHYGDALQFDGVGDYVVIDNAIALAGPFTITLWVKPVFVFPVSGALQKFMIGGPGKFNFRLSAGGTVEYRVVIGGNPYVAPMPYNIDDSDWHLIVLRRNSSNLIEAILDGDTDGAVSITTAAVDFTFSNLGRQGTQTGYYQGGLDDIRVYNKALSTDEITALYNNLPNNIFVPPVGEMSDVRCLGFDISDPATGWDTENGWETSTAGESATTTFDLEFENGRCASVQVEKDTSTTSIMSRGYNTCDLDDPRRVERALRAEY